MATCPRCGGKGWEQAWRNEDGPCGGSKLVWYKRDCSGCGASGHVKNLRVEHRKENCSTCGGKGRVSRRVPCCHYPDGSVREWKYDSESCSACGGKGYTLVAYDVWD